MGRKGGGNVNWIGFMEYHIVFLRKPHWMCSNDMVILPLGTHAKETKIFVPQRCMWGLER